MQSDHDSPQIKGVAIISLPPPDNPSLGKTITAFTLSDSDHHHYLPEPVQTHHQFQIPIPTPPPQNPQIQDFFFVTPRKLLGFVCISLFALLFYRCLFSTTLLQQLKVSLDDDDDHLHQKVQTFIFPLYHKLRTRQIPQNDLELSKLVKFVNKESLVVDQVNDSIFPVTNNKLTSVNAAALDLSAIFPMRGNVYPDGLYFTYMLVGSPPKPFYLDIDTASDLTWIQCDAPCTSCAKGANALYKPRKNNILPPKDSICLELQRNQNAGHCEGGTCQQCDYEIEYADHSSSMGVLARDELNLMMANGSSTKFNFIFGCAYDQQGLLLNTLAKTDGILGLSKAKVSLPSQMASRGIINNVVGHCLANDVDGDGYMFLGDDFVPRWGMAWVPLLDTSSTESYYTEVMKLKYGSSLLSLGGQVRRVRRVLFDSGSSYTYFTKEAYSELVAALLKEVSVEGLVQDTSDPTLPLCWQVNFPISSVADVKRFFKTITLQFGSKWWIISTKFQIPPEGYLIINGKRNVCLGILDGSDVHDGSTIILGDISLRGQLVVYDNVNEKIGWMASDCIKLNTLLPMPFFEA